MSFKENSTDLENKNITLRSGKYDEEYDGPTKLIFKPYIARRLLKKFRLVDIKPDKANSDRTVFVFADSLELRDAMQRILKYREHKKEVIDSEE